MNEQETRERRNDLTRYASRFWAGEAEIARTFFERPRAPEEHLRWLRVQAYKELQPRDDGIIIRNIESLARGYTRARAERLPRRLPRQHPVPRGGVPPLRRLRRRD